MEKGKAVLEIKKLSKHFGGIRALDNVDMTLYENEILAIVGDNGAGKSTLIKVISGVYEKTSGDIYIDGRRVEIKNPLDAKKQSIETVYQTDSMIKILSAPLNIFLGRERIREGFFGKVFKFLDYKYMREESQKLLKKLGADIKVINADVSELSGGQAQTVAISRAIYWGGKILILDEPTNNLGVVQERKVLDLIKQLKNEFKMTIVIVSHNLQHVMELVDRIMVLRNGQKVKVVNKSETSMNEIVSFITGASN